MGAMRNALLAMSIIAWAAGGALLGLGIWKVVDDSTFDQAQIMDADQKVAPVWAGAVYLMIACGALTFAVGFVGWIGTLKENTTCLLAYVILSSVAMGALAAGGGLAVGYKFEVEDGEVADNMLDNIANVYSESYGNNTVYDSWTKFQVENRCCGVRNHTDWLLNSEFDVAVPVPESCCDVLVDVNDTASAALDTCYDEANGLTDDITYLFETLASTVLAALYRRDNKISPS